MAFAAGASPAPSAPAGTQVAVAGPLLKRILQAIADPAKNPQGRLLDSRVRSGAGELLPMYRGLTRPYDPNETGYARQEYYTNNPGIADAYAKGFEPVEAEGPSVVPSFLDIKSPYYLGMSEDSEKLFEGLGVKADEIMPDAGDFDLLDPDVDAFSSIPDRHDGIILAVDDIGELGARNEHDEISRMYKDMLTEGGPPDVKMTLKHEVDAARKKAINFPQLQFVPRSREQVISPFDIMQWGLE